VSIWQRVSSVYAGDYSIFMALRFASETRDLVDGDLPALLAARAEGTLA